MLHYYAHMLQQCYMDDMNHDGQDSLYRYKIRHFSSIYFCNLRLRELLWRHSNTCADTTGNMPVCEGSGPTAGLVFLRSHPESQRAQHNPPPLIVIFGVSPKISAVLDTKRAQLYLRLQQHHK